MNNTSWIDVDCEEIKRRFLNGDKVGEIAGDLFVSSQVIYSRVKMMELTREKTTRYVKLDEEELIWRYIINKHSMIKISIYFKTSARNVERHLDKFKIPKRPRENKGKASKKYGLCRIKGE